MSHDQLIELTWILALAFALSLFVMVVLAYCVDDCRDQLQRERAAAVAAIRDARRADR